MPRMQPLTDDEILEVAAKHCEFTPEGTYHLRRYSGKFAIVQVVRECFELAELTRQAMDSGYMGAFYEIAAMLGIKGAQAESPKDVYQTQVKPALEILIACATEQAPEPPPCRHCDIRAASYRVERPSSFHYPGCPQRRNSP